MRTVIWLSVLLLAGCVSPALPAPSRTDTPSAAATATALPSSNCVVGDQIPYVYHDYRLAVQSTCLRVLAHIDLTRNEADGDVHIFARLNAADAARYLTPANAKEQGDLVVEPVCVNTPTQADAISSCASDPDPLAADAIPKTGECGWIEGRYVLDTMHGAWAEIHPLGKWTPVSAALCAARGIQIRSFDVADTAFPDPGD